MYVRLIEENINKSESKGSWIYGLNVRELSVRIVACETSPSTKPTHTNLKVHRLRWIGIRREHNAINMKDLRYTGLKRNDL